MLRPRSSSQGRERLGRTAGSQGEAEESWLPERREEGKGTCPKTGGVI